MSGSEIPDETAGPYPGDGSNGPDVLERSGIVRVSLARDNVFGDDQAARQLGTVTGDVASGYHVSLIVPVDTRTEPTGGGRPGRP